LKAEIITIGDEILIGQVVDTNSAWMAKGLNEIGWEVSRIVTISDTQESIISALDQASKRSDAVLITGGLGPTKDDVTKFALCEFFQDKLVVHEESLTHIRAMFERVGRSMNPANLQQAHLPSKCQVLQNDFGTAPGMLFTHNKIKIFSMPGVPYEMKGIMQSHVLPMLETLGGDVVEHRTFVTANVPESHISEMLEAFENSLPASCKLAYLPHFNFVRLRLTVRGKKASKLHELLTAKSLELTKILGKMVISETDGQIQEILSKILAKRKESITCAESCTGGYVSHLLTSVPGSSAYFPGSVVTYSYENKSEFLGIDPTLLWSQGAVSKEVVEQMCVAARAKMKTNYALALSGIAGPTGGTPDKPVGTVWIAVCNENEVFSKMYVLRGNRIQNIQRSAYLGLEMVRKLMCNELPSSTEGIPLSNVD
jgi:nicotinamide-nucleotide amidase